MEAFDAVTVYWFSSIGLMLGFVTSLFLEKQGIPLSGNLIWGVVGANMMGFIGIYMGIGDGVLFSFLATLTLLFLVNVFHQHHKEDLNIDLNPLKIIKKSL